MKLFIIFSIMLTSFFMGYSYKNKIINELNYLFYMKDFADYLKSNINLFKNNIVQIIDEFIILNNSKNAKFNQIFVKNGEIYQFLKENIEKFISNKQISFVIFNFLNSMGTNEYIFESEKINSFVLYVNSQILDYTKFVKEKGDLFFRIALSIGAIISIVVW